MSITLHGIGLGGHIIIGNAYIFDKSLDDVKLHTIESNQIISEQNRFKAALQATYKELTELKKTAPTELESLLSLNIVMLRDSQIAKTPLNIIENEFCNAEWAVKQQADYFSSRFDDMNDTYLKERKNDIIQLLERIFKNLDNNQMWQDIDFNNNILVTRDLSLADLFQFKDSGLIGFVNDYGSLTSHTAILGRNLEIPAVIGVINARQLIYDNELIIIDTIRGVVIINPEESIIDEYKNNQKLRQASQQKLHLLRKKDAITKDGVKIELLANIDNVNDLQELQYYNPDGIGLLRSEFIFLNHTNQLLTEEEQYEIYSKFAFAMRHKSVTIRTADIGADKNPSWNIENTATNPALGLTGIRLSLSEHIMFRTQLRAILRASAKYHNIKLMFPMISSAWELKQALTQVEQVKSELISDNIPFDTALHVGSMIEVPAAAIAIGGILDLIDFISIGTNDLIQYLLAIDRNDESVSYLYDPLHPSVIYLLNNIVKTANKKNISVSICGEMASNDNFTCLLIGLGLRKLSIHATNILPIKDIILNSNISNISHLIKKIVKSQNREQIYNIIKKINEC